MKSRKGLLTLLALVLVFSLTVTAYAAWPSFQNDADNNGVIPVSPAPPTASPTVAANQLANNYGGGIDAPSVIDDNCIAYTLYNGGYVFGTAGGARLQATTLSSPTPAVWNVQLDATADNVPQLSTPVLVGTDLYALTTGSTSLYGSSAFDTTNWTGTATINNMNNTATFPANSTTNIRSVATDVTFIAPTTNITTEFTLTPAVNDAATYTIELLDSGNSVIATLVSGATLYGGYSTALNYYSGAAIPAGSYKIKLTITTDGTNPIEVTDISLYGSGWSLYCIDTTTTPANNPSPIATGVGAANTPITHCGDYLYFGIYGGVRSYYQYDISTPALNQFAASEDFYWAGATTVTLDETNYVVFGSDSGTVYLRNVASFASTGTTSSPGVGLSITPGAIRSTIVNGGDGYYYFTSAGTGTNGYVWRTADFSTYAVVQTPSFSTVNDTLTTTTTSTPVRSGLGYVYVGYSGDYTDFVTPANSGPVGGVIGVPTASFSTGNRFQVYGTAVTTNVTGNPVQSSPIVWTDEEADPNPLDYIYFTTNSANGEGYCYSYDGSTPAQVWAAGGTSGNRYALQGFASGCGYLVYGDDDVYLYVMN